MGIAVPGLLAFHAHPDDETLSMGATLARYAAAGEQVVVVTATRGESGEIHNHDDPLLIADRLGEVRAAEVEAALRILGVEHHHFLGYRDSGMMGTADNRLPDAFWNADFMEATGRLVRLIRRYRPEVVTAYDPYGGYGHPDHIQVHRVGTAAYFGAADVGRFPLEDGDEAWLPSKLYWATFPRRFVTTMQEAALAAGDITEEEAAREPSAGTPDHDITTWVTTPEKVALKEAAVLEHVTQIPADSWIHKIPGEAKRAFLGSEPFVRVHSRVPVDGDEADLFAGLR